MKGERDSPSSFGFAELRGGGSRVTIYPELGGKIGALELGGRQWLWTSDVIPHRTPVDGASYVETADSGGYDECFPTVGPCTIPGIPAGTSAIALPDHGELWSQRPTLEIRTHNGAQSATCIWQGRRLSYRFTREVIVTPASEVVMRYAVTNEGATRLPFLWSAHPLLPLGDRTRLTMPAHARVRVFAQHGIDLFGPGAEHFWPRLQGHKGNVDLSHPESAGRRYACKLFFDMPIGIATVEEGANRLDVEFDVKQVPNFGLWINKGGWTPFKRGTPYSNLAFEPCIGAPDTLDEALGAWHGAAWLEVGATREWMVMWRGR